MRILTVYLPMLSILIITFALVSACSKEIPAVIAHKPDMSLEDKLGTRFTEVTKKHF